MSGHVIYESRLELTRLLYADFGRGAEAVFVELRSCRYRGPALAGLAGQTSPSTGLKARGRWAGPGQPGRHHPRLLPRSDARRWSALTWEHASAVHFPVSEEDLELARRCSSAETSASG